MWYAAPTTGSRPPQPRATSSRESEARTSSIRSTRACATRCSTKWGKRWFGRISPAGSRSISDVAFAFGVPRRLRQISRGDMAQSEQVGIIGKGIVIKGNLTGGGDLVIEGRVEGQIALKNHLTIESTGNVQADIQADELTINGEASGNIDASSKVAINASAKVAGDIKAPRVVIEDGAVFNGSIEMEVKLPEDV